MTSLPLFYRMRSTLDQWGSIMDCHNDAGQLAVNHVLSAPDLSQLILGCEIIEPMIETLWERGMTKVKPVRLMTADDLVQ